MEPDAAAPPRRSGVLIIAIVGVALLCCLGAVAVAGLAALLPVRQETTRVQEAEVPVTQPAEETPVPATGTIEEEAETVAFLIMTSSADWAGHITGVETATVLRRPVIVVATDIGPEQADLADEMASGLATFASGLTADDGSYYTYYFQVLSSEGDLIGAVSSTDDRWKLEIPPAPADADALATWIDEVYGPASPAPEAWVGRISSVHADADGTITVRTDLNPADPADLRAAQTIIDAINSSGATFAQSVRVLFADGVFEWSSILGGADPYYP